MQFANFLQKSMWQFSGPYRDFSRPAYQSCMMWWSLWSDIGWSYIKMRSHIKDHIWDHLCYHLYGIYYMYVVLLPSKQKNLADLLPNVVSLLKSPAFCLSGLDGQIWFQLLQQFHWTLLQLFLDWCHHTTSELTRFFPTNDRIFPSSTSKQYLKG